MGSQISSQVQNEVQEGQKTVKNLKHDMMSRQVELVRRMAERQMAMQVASVRELMLWFIPFSVTSYIFLYKGYKKTNSWPVMFPLIPITFGLGYQLHYAYGNKTNDIKVLAEKIMANEAHMMAVPEWSSNVTELMQSGNLDSITQTEDASHRVAFISQTVSQAGESTKTFSSSDNLTTAPKAAPVIVGQPQEASMDTATT